ncbi:MAG TPA: LuxR C-terminal-related transcriptional regulator, partial [Acidimicrobiales bacterium]
GAGRGVLLVGEAGSGKSRLAEDVASRWETDGGAVVRLIATPSAREIPLGAVAHLLPRDVAVFSSNDGEMSRLRVFQAAEEACARITNLERALVLVDDIDLLDGLSAVLVCKQLDTTSARVIATMRSDARPVDDIVRLRGSGKLTEIEVASLGPHAVEEVTTRVLGGPADPATLAALAQTSQGNPLLLRELLTGALERGDLRADPLGIWRLHRPPTGTRRVNDLIDERLRALPADARRAMEVLAIAGEIPLQLVEDIAGAGALDHLDAEALVSVRIDGARAFVRTAHPLHAEVMRNRVGTLGRRRLFGTLTEALRNRGIRRREDPVRLALWQLDSGQGADVDLLLRAARLSLSFLDPEPAIRLATAAGGPAGKAAAALIVAEAYSIQGRYREVEDVLAGASGDLPSLSADDRARFAGRRASNLAHGLGDGTAAYAVLREALAPSQPSSAERFLLAKQAVIESVVGDVAVAITESEDLVSDADLEVRTQVGYARGLALVHAGRVADTLSVSGQAFRDHTALEGTPGHGHPATQLFATILALAIDGRLDSAARLTEGFRKGAEQVGNNIGLLAAHTFDGEVALLAGDMTRAERAFTLARAAAAGLQHSWMHAKAATGHGMVLLAMGDVDGARDALAAADSLTVAIRWARLDRERLRAWVLASDGTRPEAVALLQATADDAAAHGDRWFEAMLRHDAVRLGERTGATRLAAIAQESDACFLQDLATHARAWADRSPGALADASEAFATHGYMMLATTTAAEAAIAASAAGDQRAARDGRRRQALFAERCPGLYLPDLGEGESVEPLTTREREIALLAAQRRSNKEIADQLFLSVRTVENHLARAYEKLGVKGRRDLAEALEREG